MTTPQEKADLIESKHGNQIRMLWKYLVEVTRSRRNLDHCAVKAIQIVDQMGNMVFPYSACRKGCGHCCHQATIISSWEAKRIAKATKRKINMEAGVNSPEIEQMLRDFTGIPCPFLKDSQCSVYEVRPFMCRLHFSLDDDDLNCDIIRSPGATVPYFDFEKVKTLLAALFVQHGDTFADIREFFDWKNENI